MQFWKAKIKACNPNYSDSSIVWIFYYVLLLVRKNGVWCQYSIGVSQQVVVDTFLKLSAVLDILLKIGFSTSDDPYLKLYILNFIR